jgi:hypothetical protein
MACQSETRFEPVDNLASLLSHTHLISESSTKIHRESTNPQRLNIRRKDGIDLFIRDVLDQDLNVARGDEMLRPSHPCFDIARDYARKWGISDQAVNNLVELACGYLKFPVLILLNPSPKHETLGFAEMVGVCGTLDWIQKTLEDINLTLADVIILDICPLLSDGCIEAIGKEKEKKKQAMYEAYDVTWQMLDMIRPNIIVSCQCSTQYVEWGDCGHPIALSLCSSMVGARTGQIRKTDVKGHTIYVVQAYHPGGFLNYPNHEDPDGVRLRKLLHRLYLPCASWKEKQNPIDALIVALDNHIDAINKSTLAIESWTLEMEHNRAMESL